MAELTSDGTYSMNVWGLKDQNKRVHIFLAEKKKKKNGNANIFLLQETHSSTPEKNAWKEDWGNNNMFFLASWNIKLQR